MSSSALLARSPIPSQEVVCRKFIEVSPGRGLPFRFLFFVYTSVLSIIPRSLRRLIAFVQTLLRLPTHL